MVPLIWLVIILFGWFKLVELNPAHVTFISIICGVATALQVYAVVDLWVAEYRQRLEVNELAREANDAMAEAMKDEDDLSPLPRAVSPVNKLTKDMTADELLNHSLNQVRTDQ